MLDPQSILDGWVGGCHIVAQIKDCTQENKIIPNYTSFGDFMKHIAFDWILEGWGKEGCLEISEDQKEESLHI